MPKRTRPYRSWHQEKLANPKIAAGYLNASLAESREACLAALREVAQANGMASVAREAGVQRETLYRALSSHGNPTFDTFLSVLNALGMTMNFAAAEVFSSTAAPEIDTIDETSRPVRWNLIGACVTPRIVPTPCDTVVYRYTQGVASALSRVFTASVNPPTQGVGVVYTSCATSEWVTGTLVLPDFYVWQNTTAPLTQSDATTKYRIAPQFDPLAMAR